ncbi:hypothetical protein [Kineococcus sp. SYSU DK002]|uniref:hypothetical protein n=1 Tax=Kineococcus sp. SYSU DK002 TaxID=3383123 RepID=UPI003D7D682C
MNPTIGPVRPPFGFSLDAPDGWEALRSAPGELHDDLLAVVTRSAVWPGLDARRRRGLANLLGLVAQAAAASGAIATFLRSATAPGGDPETGVVTVSWTRTAPLRADLDLARLVLEADRSAPEVPTGVGPGVRVDRTGTGPTGGPWSTTQLAVPVPDSVWLATFTGTALAGTSVGAVRQAVAALAGSLRVERRVRGAA